MSFCNASVELRCTCIGVVDSGEFFQQVATCYFYWWHNCAGWGETDIIESDKNYAASRRDRLTGFMLVGRRYKLSRQEGLACYLINIPYPILQHIRIQTVWCLPSSFCRVLRPIKLAENIFIKERLYNAFSVSRFTIGTERSINEINTLD
jgi:hypothetical protein